MKVNYAQIIKNKGIKNTYIANKLGVSRSYLTNLLKDESGNFKTTYENDLRRLLDMPVETGFNDYHGTTILEGDTLYNENVGEYLVCWNKENKVFYLESGVIDGFLFLSEQCEKMEVMK